VDSQELVIMCVLCTYFYQPQSCNVTYNTHTHTLANTHRHTNTHKQTRTHKHKWCDWMAYSENNSKIEQIFCSSLL